MAFDSTSNTQSQTVHLVPTSTAMIADEYANNPFFLPTNEKPGLMLTLQPLTSPENYMSWVRSVFLGLSSRNKFGFVDGSIAKPNSSFSLYNSWRRCNTTVLSWLTNSLSLDLKASVMYINNARDLWIDLKDRLSQGNTPSESFCGNNIKQKSYFHLKIVVPHNHGF